MSLSSDATRRPDLFRWNGRLERGEIEAWSRSSRLLIPDDLLSLWCQTAGGDLFESETLLAPLIPGMDNIDEYNSYLRGLGRPKEIYVYHVGAVTSAIEAHRGALVQIDPRSWLTIQAYRSLSEWYDLLRAEYAARYAL